MKKFGAALLAVLGVVFAVALGPSAPGASAADTDDFSFSSFDGQYHLATDEAGRSSLTVVETLVAEFPEFDQNRGIRRDLVDSYDGHSTGLLVVSVTDENGTPRPFELDDSDTGQTLTIAGDAYVHGTQVYVITYTQHDVTKYFADADVDEFYWDVNGVDWPQSFGTVSATVHLSEELEPALNGDVDAAWGREGEKKDATIDGLSFSAEDLGPGENLTFSIGFEPHTFVERKSGFFDSIWPSLSLIGLLVLLGLVVVLRMLRVTRWRDAPGRGTIIAQYEPPRGVSLQLSSLLAGTTTKSMSAQIIDLAVSGNVRVIETESTLFGKKFRLDLVGFDGLSGDSLEFIRALFGSDAEPGSSFELGKHDSRAASELSKVHAAVAEDSYASGFRRKPEYRLIVVLLGLSLLVALFTAIAAIAALDQNFGGAWPVVFLIASAVLLVLEFILVAKVPLTRRGSIVREEMSGLKEFIEWAEADRLRFLQSPEGAQRQPIDGDDDEQLVRLHERLLPYAMLFGQEKRWTEELGTYYERLETEPSWYAGSGSFNAALFVAGISSVSTSATSTFSSSSSGSSGSASSGGGGGGGGGGGV